jgi:curved DNA-binding protein
MDDDFYKVLGVSRDASQSDIQRAYRELARKSHPDMNPNDKDAKEKFQRIQQAYDVLKNPEKREMYDRYGSSFESMGAGGPRGGSWRTQQGGAPFGGFEEFDFSQIFGGRSAEGFGDIFRGFTGGRSQGRKASRQRGADLQHEIEIPFTTSITGGEVNLTVQRPGGKVETLSVKVPPGIESGKRIRVRGQGESSATGGPQGDILIQVRVKPHAFYRRNGKDLEVAVPISLAEAAEGSKVDVPTPQGTISLTVPPASSSGRRLRIKGHGVPQPDGSKGDLFAQLQIVLPDQLDGESLKLVRQLDERNPLNPRSELRW